VETLFVVDAMQGQDAGEHRQGLQGGLPLTGIILTKLDGDSRGGAALSVRQITGAPIKFAGVSEKIDGLEVFDAERHAGRILGMGDIVALVEQVQAGVDMEGRAEAGRQGQERRGLRPQRLPGADPADEADGRPVHADGQDARADAGQGGPGRHGEGRARHPPQGRDHLLDDASERRKPEIIKATRKRRIAAGAGVQVQEVNRLLNEFEQMQTMMKKMKGGG
jgi:signal recognition particle subunit SRP54